MKQLNQELLLQAKDIMRNLLKDTKSCFSLYYTDDHTISIFDGKFCHHMNMISTESAFNYIYNELYFIKWKDDPNEKNKAEQRYQYNIQKTLAEIELL